MKLIFLGSGSAFTVGVNNYHSNMLLDSGGGQKLLIDCGSDIRFSLHALGLSHHDVNDVYISHLHADHVGGVEWLGFVTKFDPACKKPGLYICDKLVDSIWHNVLLGGMSSLQTEVADLSTYFDVHPIKEHAVFTWQQLHLRIVQTIHVFNGPALIPSYGLIFVVDGLTVFITTDTQFCFQQMQDFYATADIIFHDCETVPHKSKVHAHYEELVTLPAGIKNKMWLYHYNPGALPDAVRDGFRGFVHKGQCFDFCDQRTLK